jgi:hypothetical protein
MAGNRHVAIRGGIRHSPAGEEVPTMDPVSAIPYGRKTQHAPALKEVHIDYRRHTAQH